MKQYGQRGTPIGAVTSQLIGNLAVKRIDHKMKANGKGQEYFRYCDDVVGLARTKAEAKRKAREFYRTASELGLCVKANIVLSPIGQVRQTNETRQKKRKRQRGGRRTRD